jgi:DNA-binding MarR family transcriptional regulator
MADQREAVEACLIAGRALAAITVRALEASPTELNLPGHRILLLLSAHGPQRIRDLADLLGVHSSNATRHCDRLQDGGLVARRASTEDGRAVMIDLTEKGRATLRAIADARREGIAAVLTDLPAETLAQVSSGMSAFSEAAGEPSDLLPAHVPADSTP